MTKPAAASAAAGKASFNKHQFHHSLTILVDHRRTPDTINTAMQCNGRAACCQLLFLVVNQVVFTEATLTPAACQLKNTAASVINDRLTSDKADTQPEIGYVDRPTARDHS